MMDRTGWMAGSLLGAALLVSGTALAQTQPRYDHPEAGEQQDLGDDYDGERAGAARQADEAVASPEQGRPEEDFSDVVAADEQRGRRAAAEPRSRAPVGQEHAPAADALDEEAGAMTDACALAARDEAERDGGYAEVRQMETPRESRNGFSIDGDVETRSGWSAQDGRVRHFTCTVANGRVEDVFFQRERVAR